MTIAIDTPRNLSHFTEVSLRSPYRADWFTAKDFSSCKIGVSILGEVEIDYFSEHTGRKRVPLQNFRDFLEWMTMTRHTFICNTPAELDACINLCPDLEFKLLLYKNHQAVYNGLRFYRTEHKLNIRRGNDWWSVWDVSDVSREGPYHLKILNDAEDIRLFTISFLQMCLDFGLVVSSELTWSNLAQNFLMRSVPDAWPDWNRQEEREFQFEFFRWAKSSYHSARALGPYSGTSFDGVRSHLNILYNLVHHSPFYCDYKQVKRFRPDAAYGLYRIHTSLPERSFLPWRLRVSDDDWSAFFEVHGEQVVVVTQQELEGVMEVLGFKPGKDFEVLKAFVVIPRKVVYPYRHLCQRVTRLLDEMPSDSQVKSMYHRFIGKMFQIIHGEGKGLLVASTSCTFDPMVAATVWATERVRVWKVLSSSRDQYSIHMDGAEALLPTLDSRVFSVRSVGERFGFSHQLRDDVGKNDIQLLVEKCRDLDHIEVAGEVQITFGATVGSDIPLSAVGTKRLVVRRFRPGYNGREKPSIKMVGVLLGERIDVGTIPSERVRARFIESKEEASEWLMKQS